MYQFFKKNIFQQVFRNTSVNTNLIILTALSITSAITKKVFSNNIALFEPTKDSVAIWQLKYKKQLLPIVSKPVKGPNFWVVNFGTARTLAHKKFGFAAGMGGQMVFLGDPQKTSGFFTIPHAGFRYGLGKKIDIGLRLAPIPLPFSTVGPGFGVNIDTKICVTKPESTVDFSVVLGLGGAHVLIEDNSRYAYSPNAALLNSYKLNKTSVLTIMGRFVHLAITTAPQGAKANFVNISGISFGLRKNIRPNIAILPEIGTYWYQGKIINVSKNGLGLQYGVMIGTSF
jgi:hypothetical protein